MLRSILSKSLFVFALLFTQQVAVMHTIEHTWQEQKETPASPHHQHCDLCAVDAEMGSAIGSSHIFFDFSSAFAEISLSQPDSYSSCAFAAFEARAPPCAA